MRTCYKLIVLLHQLAKSRYYFIICNNLKLKKPAVSDRLSLGSRLARVRCHLFQHLDPEPQWQQLQQTFSPASTSASNSQTKNMPNCHILQGSNTLILIALPNIFCTALGANIRRSKHHSKVISASHIQPVIYNLVSSRPL